MTNPVTPNIGLNKIDRTSPATTYFDLEKYIDQNADTVDRFAGEASQAIEALQQRLDTEARREVVLQPGLQIVNAERSAPFSLSGIKGRTLVNLLGRDGRFSSLGHVAGYGNHSVALDSTNKTIGDNGLKIVSLGKGNAGDASNLIRIGSHTYKDNARYIIIADIKANTPFTLHCELWGGLGSVKEAEISTPWSSVVFRGIGDSRGQGLHFWNLSDKEVTFYLSGLRIYEVTEADYNETDEKLIQKYPYVDSIQPVRNPYAIRYGENLLPPFYEWETTPEDNSAPYVHTIKATTSTPVSAVYKIKPVVGRSYTYSIEFRGGGRIGLDFRDAGGNILVTSGWLDQDSITLEAPTGSEIMQIFVSSGGQIGTFTFKNPMLTIGSEAKPFKPREDSMLALQTDLFADPVTGANADEVFEKDGQYFILAKWKEVYLDGSYNWLMDVTFPELKRLKIVTNNPTLDGSELFTQTYSTKFDGTLLDARFTGPNKPDQILRNPTNKILYVTVSNTDSGWGDNYTPTADEIKAYFMGWKMYDTSGSTASVYNRTDNTFKGWVRRRASDGAYVDGTGTLPVIMAAEYTPYKLVYQLAAPTVEPIVSEGMLTFNEGINQVEIGTGIVFREPIAAVKDGGGRWNLGNTLAWTNAPGFKNKARDIKGVYKNSRLDTGWVRFITDKVGAAVQEPSPNALYDPTATYTVTYRMLDNSPIVPFSGSYAANEKAILQELTNAVQQNASAVSVLMNKKADKDAPGWITPTLLNGWASRNTGYDAPLSYRKIDGLGVQVRGIIQLGTTGTVFFLPDGYRPEKTHFCNVMGYMQAQASYIYPYITVTPEGDFRIDAVTSPPTWLIIDTIIPL